MIRPSIAFLRPIMGVSLGFLLHGCALDDPGDVSQGLESAPTSGTANTASNGPQNVAPLNTSDQQILTLTDEEAAAAAEAAHQQVNLNPIDGLEVNLWASETLLGDPVAISVDYQGRVWAAVTNRSNNSEFDIRGYRDWETPSMRFQSVEDRRDFLRTELAPERSSVNAERIPDRNEDGVHDWRDLAVVKEQVTLLEDTSGLGLANRSQLFLKDFHSEVTDVLGGIYYHNELGELFLGAAPTAWRVRDADGDGRADTKTALADGFAVHIGFSGHGMSGVTLGPDGRIYYGIGDIGANITDLDGNRWAYPNQGVVVRSEPDGSDFEVFSAGVRNTHEFTFDQYGNLITVDNDGDHDGEYERLTYLIDGSDSGWRTNWQLGKYTDPKNNRYKVWMDEGYFKTRFDQQAAHLLPPIAPYHAGPTGMTYNPGTALNSHWQEHFFVVEFVGSEPRSGVHAFTLEPKGASFELASNRSIFRGLQATGIDFGPDGTLYMADWVEGWQRSGKGRVWTLDVTQDSALQDRDSQASDAELRRQTQQLLAADVEQWSLDELQEHLAHPDMRVRQRAQFELVDRGQLELLETLAAEHSDQLARIHAIWGLGQLARQEAGQAASLVALLADEDAEIRAQVAKILGDTPYPAAFSELVSRLADPSPRVQFFATQALGRIGEEKAFEPLIGMLAANDDEDVYLRHAGAIALARLGQETKLGALAQHESEAVRLAAVVALRRLESTELQGFLTDASEFVVTNAARGISDDHFVKEALPALAEQLNQTPYTNEPLMRRMINANLYVGGQASVERLLAFARRDDIAGVIRAEAIDTLSVWPESSPFDRVTGRHRGSVSHPEAQASAGLADAFAALMADASVELRQSTVRAAGALQLQEVFEPLLAALAQDPSPAVRTTALQTLFDLNYYDMRRAAQTAMQDREQAVRTVALTLMPELGLPAKDLVEMHQLLLDNGFLSEQQAAYRSLANVQAPEAQASLQTALQQVQSGTLPAEVHLDVIAAVQATENDELLAQLASYDASKNADEPTEVYREALHGGSAWAGFEQFQNNNSAQCMRCHVVSGRGAKVGPDLTKIGAQLSREQLLEALVDPNARLPAGHGRVAVTLENGATVSGFLEAETDRQLTIVDQGETVSVNKTDVTDTVYSGSGMPPMGSMLAREEIRDLVEFLTTLTDAERAADYWR